jgi:hypothetical protein
LTWRHTGFWLFFGALVLGGGCKQILSIEDAELDPTLTAGTGGDAGGGSGGTGGDSGSGGTAGSGGHEHDARADGGARGDADAGSLCEQYCSAVATHCTGEHTLYTDWDVCIASCALLPAGQPSDQVGNSVHCRLNAALKIPTLGEPEFYCPRAGPGGNGKCGTNCEGYCKLMQQVCVGGNQYFDSDQACMLACQKVRDLDTYSIGTPRAPTVQCRLLHVCNSIFEADDHCGHAAGEAPCNDPDGG